MDKELVVNGLRPAATVKERVAALKESGIRIVTIGEILDVSPEAIRQWRTGNSAPRPEVFKRLDTLRAAMGQLLVRGLEPEQAANWLQSVPDQPPYVRPIELVAEQPETVFARIEQETFTRE
jgi:hypothetical protein